jgi:hypothetical protein
MPLRSRQSEGAECQTPGLTPIALTVVGKFLQIARARRYLGHTRALQMAL